MFQGESVRTYGFSELEETHFFELEDLAELDDRIELDDSTELEETSELDDIAELDETNELDVSAEFEDVVVSCGGGTPCFFDNMDYLNQQAQVVWLRCEPEVLKEHLLMGKGDRPLLKGKTPDELSAFIREQLEWREPYYRKARYTLDVSLMDNNEKIKITIAKLKELLDL